MSKSKQKTTSSQTTNQTATTTPNTPAWIAQPWQQYTGKVTDLMNSDTPLVSGPSALQEQAFAGAANLGTSPWFAQAAGMASQVGAAGPNTATAQGYQASGPAGGQGYQAAGPVSQFDVGRATVGDIGRASAGSVANVDLNKYLNAGLGDQIDATRADYAADAGVTRARQSAAQAYSGGARNSNNAVLSALTEGELTRAANTGLANVRANAYDQAAGLATNDLNRSAQVSMANASGQTQAALAQAGIDASRYSQLGDLQMRAGLDYAGRQDAAGQFGANAANQSALDYAGRQDAAGQFGAAAQNNMNQFNAGQQDNALMRQLQAAGMLGDLGNSVSNNNRANIALQGELGGVQREIANAQASGDFARLAAIQQLLGGIPLDAFVGQTATNNGTSSGSQTTKNSGFSLGWNPATGLSIGG